MRLSPKSEEKYILTSDTLPSEYPSLDVKLNYPVDNINELKNTFHLQNILRKQNKPESDTTKEEKERQFDYEVVESSRSALVLSGLDFESDVDGESGWVHALMLMTTRAMSMDDTVTHLEEYDQTRKKIGLYDSPMSKSTIHRRKKEIFDISEQDLQKILYEASLRILYYVYRRGVPIPETVRKNHINKGDEMSPIVRKFGDYFTFENMNPSSKLEDVAIRDWADTFIDVCLSHISFDREENKRHPVMAILGLMAHAALQRAALSTATKTCEGWYAEYGNVPTQGCVMPQLTNVSNLGKMAMSANNGLLELLTKYGILDNPLQLSYDLTNIYWTGEEESDNGWRKGHGESYKGSAQAPYADEKWTFGIITSVEKDREYALGIYPVGKNVGRDDVATKLLRNIFTNSSIKNKRIYMDRGFDSSAMIKRMSDTTGESWVIHARKQHAIEELLKEVPDNEARIKKDIGMYEVSEKPNVVVHPISDDESHTDRAQRAFITGLSVDEISEIKIHYEHKNRDRIESTLGQIKDQTMPNTESRSTPVRYFYFIVGMIFYNLHEVANKALSPSYGIPIGKNIGRDLTHKEVLSGIREACFDRVD